jgi:hypothetical protein
MILTSIIAARFLFESLRAALSHKLHDEIVLNLNTGRGAIHRVATGRIDFFLTVCPKPKLLRGWADGRN